MVTFAAKFQTASTYEANDMFTLEQLEVASNNVATAQVELIPNRVTTTVKSIVKEGHLYKRPFIGVFDNNLYTCGGRHRIAAIKHICEHYGVNAAGQLVEFTGDVSDTLLERIEPVVNCEVAYATSKAVIGHLQMADNGSRSMTQAESNLVKATFAKLSALASLQMAFAAKIEAALGCTFQTGLAIAKKISAAFPKMFVYSTTQQLDLMLSWLADYHSVVMSMPEDNELYQVLTGNFSRNYGKFIESFLNWDVATGEEDEDGEEIVQNVVTFYGTQLVKPEKASKAVNKSSELERQVALLTAKLQEQQQQLAAAGLQ